MEKEMGYMLKVMGLLVTCLFVFACTPGWEDEFEIDYSKPSDNPGQRIVNTESRNVLILYSAGFNNLSGYLKEDIADLTSGWLPGGKRSDDVILVYSHFPSSSSNYSEPSSPVLTRLYAGPSGEAVSDTLEVYDSSVISSSPKQLNAVLKQVRDLFPAAGYGMVFSSHATGYLPAGFYQNSSGYIYKGKAIMQMDSGWHGAVAAPYVEIPHDSSLPAVKSIGQDRVGDYGSYISYEMELADFAEAIPMKMDYIIFDACLMGGIEVAYELRGKTSVVCFSQAEVLAEGLNYKALATHLLQGDKPYPVEVCRDYFEQYDSKEGAERSATVSAVDCDSLESLAELCHDLFERYRTTISSMPSKGVQRYYRSNYHWFYDLESILVNAGITDDELGALREALDRCVLYKASTPGFMNTFEINTFSGFSMYLPSHGSAELNKFYRTLQWNKATGLVL